MVEGSLTDPKQFYLWVQQKALLRLNFRNELQNYLVNKRAKLLKSYWIQKKAICFSFFECLHLLSCRLCCTDRDCVFRRQNPEEVPPQALGLDRQRVRQTHTLNSNPNHNHNHNHNPNLISGRARGTVPQWPMGIRFSEGHHGQWWWISWFVWINQFASISSPRRVIRSFVCSFSRVSGSGESRSSLSRSDSAPPSFSFKRITIVQWCKCSSINTTLTKFLSAEEGYMFRIRMLLPGCSGDVSVLQSSPNSQWTNGDSWVPVGMKRGIRPVRSC